MTEELADRYEELNRKCALGIITDVEYWEELRILDCSTDALGRGLGVEEFRGFIKGVALQALFVILPVALFAFLAYILLFYYPTPEGVNIAVAGPGIIPASRPEKEAVYRALELAETQSPDDYALIDAYVERIEVAGPTSLGLFGGRNVGSYTPSWGGKIIRLMRGFDCPAHCTSDGWTGRDLFLASILVHEACHSMQYHTGIVFAEPQCYEMQFEFMKEVGPKLWSDFSESQFVYEHPEAGLNF